MKATSLVTPREMTARWKKPLIWRSHAPVSRELMNREKRSEGWGREKTAQFRAKI